MNFARKISAGLLAVSLVGSLQASENPALIEFVRPLGMGGAFTAVADDHNVFNFNPAGMVQRTGAEVTILEVAGGVSKDFVTGTEFISDNESKLTDFENQSPAEQARLVNEIIVTQSQLDNRIYVAGDVASFVSGPKFFGLPVHGGFGLFGVVDGTFGLEARTIPSITYQINSDLVIPLSIAKRFEAPLLPGKIGVGVTGKFIRRSQVRQIRQSVLVLDDLEAPPATDGSGMGADVGLLYQGNSRLNIGMMIRDFGGTRMTFDALPSEKGYPAQAERETVIRSQLNFGVAVVPEKLLWLLPTNDRLTLAADVRDVNEKDQHIFFENGFKKPFGDNLWTHVHLGAEYRYWFMRFRGGAYQGYPSFGLGLDIPVLKLDYAFYSRELGARAGDRREENHVVSFALRFGSGYTESRERINAAKKAGVEKRQSMPESTPDSTPVAE